MTVITSQTFEFFKTFSRLEYALKTIHKYRQSKKSIHDEVKASLLNFIKTHETSLKEEFKTSESLKYIIENPPKKLVYVTDIDIDWCLLNQSEDFCDKLQNSISTVRNNLFHGSKLLNSCYPEERDKLLLSYTLEILKFLIDLDPQIKEEFNKQSNDL